MDTAGSLGAIVALIAALVWGSGDYVGGRATRSQHPYQVLALGSLSGLVLLILAALLRREPWPVGTAIAWSAAAGVAGGFGIALLYQGLASGQAAIVSPTSAVVGASLPVLISALTVGVPGSVGILGMLAGLLGIWLVTRGSSTPASGTRRGLILGVLAGIGFGGFFICMAQVPPETVFSPLVVAKAVAIAFASGVLVVRKVSWPGLLSNPPALAAGVLDAGGNVFYLIAAHMTRIDFAALIASMSPAVTVVLAGFIGKQHISRLQWLGVALCMIGVAMIAA
jgi:drug/metabolite transporter (DMT)-like permease